MLVWLSVLKALSPLEFIRDMTKLILDHRTSLESQRLFRQEKELQFEKVKIENVAAKAELLRKWGVPQDRIQKGMAEALLGEKVSKYIDALQRAKVESVDYE
jgi:hypothetical protein